MVGHTHSAPGIPETPIRFNHHGNQEGAEREAQSSPGSRRDHGMAPLTESYQHHDRDALRRRASLRWNRSSERNAGDGQGLTVPLRQSPFLGQLIHPVSQAFRMSFLVGLSPHPTSFPHKSGADMETNTLQVHPSMGWSGKNLSSGTNAEKPD